MKHEHVGQNRSNDVSGDHPLRGYIYAVSSLVGPGMLLFVASTWRSRRCIQRVDAIAATLLCGVGECGMLGPAVTCVNVNGTREAKRLNPTHTPMLYTLPVPMARSIRSSRTNCFKLLSTLAASVSLSCTCD